MGYNSAHSMEEPAVEKQILSTFCSSTLLLVFLLLWDPVKHDLSELRLSSIVEPGVCKVLFDL